MKKSSSSNGCGCSSQSSCDSVKQTKKAPVKKLDRGSDSISKDDNLENREN